MEKGSHFNIRLMSTGLADQCHAVAEVRDDDEFFIFRDTRVDF